MASKAYLPGNPMLRRILIWSVLMLMCSPGLQGQGLSGVAPSAVDPALTRLFGEFQNFTANATVRVYDQSEQEMVSTEMKFAVKDGSMRMDLNLSQLKSKDLPAGASEALRQLGMTNVISLMLPARESSYIVYPGLKAILKVTMTEDDLKSSNQSVKLNRQPIGRETLDGHPCIKYRVTLTDPGGKSQDAMTWNATDLKGFPIQIQTADTEHLIIMRFRKPKIEPPSSALFRLPEGYTEYESQQALMQAIMMKAFSSLGSE